MQQRHANQPTGCFIWIFMLCFLTPIKKGLGKSPNACINRIDIAIAKERRLGGATLTERNKRGKE